MLASLPLELLIIIFSYLSSMEVGRRYILSKQFHRILSSDQFWNYKFQSTYGMEIDIP